MTQTLPASLVAPTRASQSVGYQIRAVDGATIATAFTITGVAEDGTFYSHLCSFRSD
jgi:hypothetical protein